MFIFGSWNWVPGDDSSVVREALWVFLEARWDCRVWGGSLGDFRKLRLGAWQEDVGDSNAVQGALWLCSEG